MKCEKCGKNIGLFNPGVTLKDGFNVCNKCMKELGFDKDNAKYYVWDEIRFGREKWLQYKNAKAAANYVFLAHSDDPKVEKLLKKYQRDNTDKEDKYDGYTVRELKESCDYGTRHYEYPPLDVYAELREAEVDGKLTYEIYIFDGEKAALVGYPPKTKVKKIREILGKYPVCVKGEIEGGHYMQLKDNGWVETDYPDEDMKVRITLDWSDCVTFDNMEV